VQAELSDFSMLIMRKVEVYSSPGCKHCRVAKAKLSELRVPFDIIDVSLDDTSSNTSIQHDRTHHALSHTVPQIYVGDEHVGGCAELLNEVSCGTFDLRLHRNGVIVGRSATLNNPTSTSTRQGGAWRPTKGEPLNALRFSAGLLQVPELACQVSQQLQSLALMLLDLFASADGRSINYDSMRESAAFQSYIELSCQLQFCDLRELAAFSHEEKVAFWGNLYNVLIIHAKCVLRADEDGADYLHPQSPEAIAKRGDLYSGRSGAVYRIGGANDRIGGANDSGYTVEVTPDIIEHAILRANYPHPSQVTEALSTYAASGCDTHSIREMTNEYYQTLTFLAREHAVVRHGLPIDRERFDARVHFVLNCGARSCPPIRVLRAEVKGSSGDAMRENPTVNNIEKALSSAAAAYLEEEVRLDETNRALYLPRLLMWYGRDFGADITAIVEKVVAMLPGNAPTQVRERLQGLIHTVSFTADGSTQAEGYSVMYNPYNWEDNSQLV
jgi:glutaredoxin